MKKRVGMLPRLLCFVLVLATLATALVGCSDKNSEVPDGYQYATCRGEYFRLFLPTQWTVNTAGGVSGGYISLATETIVTMAQVEFDPASADAEGEETAAEATTATLDDFYAHHLAEVSRMRDYELERQFDTTLGGVRAKEVYYGASLGEKSYRYRQVLTKAQGRFYLFTFSSTADTFDTWLDVVDGILDNVIFEAYPYEGGEDDRKIPSDEEYAMNGMQLVSNREVAYAFYAPESWIADKTNAAYLVYASEEDRSNVTMLSYLPEDEGYSVADYWEYCEKYYKDALNGYTLLSTAEGKMGGRNATIYEYTYTVGGVTYKTRQACCVYSTMIYIMTYTALPELYDAHLGEVDTMQDSLTFWRDMK